MGDESYLVKQDMAKASSVQQGGHIQGATRSRRRAAAAPAPPPVPVQVARTAHPLVEIPTPLPPTSGAALAAAMEQQSGPQVMPDAHLSMEARFRISAAQVCRPTSTAVAGSGLKLEYPQLVSLQLQWCCRPASKRSNPEAAPANGRRQLKPRKERNVQQDWLLLRVNLPLIRLLDDPALRSLNKPHQRCYVLIVAFSP